MKKNQKSLKDVYAVTVSIELRLEVKAANEQCAIQAAENMELPSGYVEDSFEIKKVERVIPSCFFIRKARWFK